MLFDFNAAVTAPFRMQPGLRRMASGSLHLTPVAPGSRHQREKLAVLSAFWPQALQQQPGFDAGPALQALCALAQREYPQTWAWHGRRAQALGLGTAVTEDGQVEQLQAGAFGLGDEVARCLHGLPAAWRLAGLLSLAFVEDFALVEGHSGTIPWLAVCLPSHWAPEDKVGLPFAAVHAPVADNQRVLRAADGLMRMLTGSGGSSSDETRDETSDETIEKTGNKTGAKTVDDLNPDSKPGRWERFVWNVTDQPRLNAHPAHSAGTRWAQTSVDQAWWRTERQTFIPVPHLPSRQAQAIFTIHVQVQPLVDALTTPAQAQRLHDAIESMPPAVLAYRGLQAVRAPLLHWLRQRA